MIVKTKFKCKGTSSVGSFNGPWVDRFIEGKWYDGEYETWETKFTSEEDMYRMNGGWRKYWAINEQGEKEELSKAHFKITFHYDLDKIRDAKIDDLLS
jgi:hypothetical protein